MMSNSINDKIRELLDMADEKGLTMVNLTHSPVKIDEEMHTEYVLVLRD